jgi:small subunit ribosomal protein S20
VSKRRAADKKHLRKSIKRNQRNKTAKSIFRMAMKNFEDLGNTEERQKAIPVTTAAIDRAATRKVMHRNKAARLKSRIAKQAVAA